MAIDRTALILLSLTTRVWAGPREPLERVEAPGAE
jgi:hypothetical protein